MKVSRDVHCWVRCTMVLCALVCLACCEQSKPPPAFSSGTPISDLSLTLSLRDGSGAEEYYTLERDGTFGFGGGMDARFDRTSWTTQLNAEEMQGLRDLILEQGWLKGALTSSKQPPNARYRIEMRLGQQSLLKSIKGENEHVEPVRLALRDIANRRLKPDLERLPKPNLEQRPTTAAATGPATQPQ